MQRVGVPAHDAGDEIRFVFAEVAVRFGCKVPPDLDQVLRYYVSVEVALRRAAAHVLAVAKIYGIARGPR
jgi:hypothetical protein